MENSLIIQNSLMESFNKYKNNIAIEYCNKKISYDELDKESHFIKELILRNGIANGTFVGILCSDKVKNITSIIGTLRAGCVIVPLEYSYPKERLKEMIRCINLKYIITDDINIIDTFNNIGNIRCIYYDSMNDNKFIHCDNIPNIVYSPDDKIYVYFTSGSTGLPKAVVGMNKSLMHFISWEINTFHINDKFRVSQFTNCSFDVFLRDIFVPLCSGGTIFIPESIESLLSCKEVTNWINNNCINLIHCVPSLFRFINNDRITQGDYTDLKYVLLAGENIKPVELKNWYDIFDDRIQLVNLYGPTETTLAKLFYLINKDDINKKNIPVGKPISGTRAIILKSNMELCDTMELGEVYIRTPYRSLGYYNDDVLNNERFIKNPFNNDPTDIIYKTGDLGRFLLDGNIELLGRIDRQIKIRGIRIEPGEIENHLLKIDSVKQAIVVARENNDNEKYLCAYLIMKKDIKIQINLEKIRTIISKKLPIHMMPAYFIELDKIPLTPNGKLDIDALPNPERIIIGTYMPVNNKVVEKITRIWSSISGIEESRIDINSNFFEIGGNSISIIQLSTVLKKEFEVEVPISILLKYTTINSISKYLAENLKS